ncbi:MAG TPA: helix-turn-helix domain-containing protein [Gemmata sp.]|nr:helix-turn-helix domain-containing protein [Gemmata sp.]
MTTIREKDQHMRHRPVDQQREERQKERALRNATSYPDRHGRGDQAPMPSPDQLKCIEQIAAALGAVFRYLRQEHGRESLTETNQVGSLGESPDQPEPEVRDSDIQKEQRDLKRSFDKPVVDTVGFRLLWQGKIYTLKNTNEFRILAHLARNFGSWVPSSKLISVVWEDRVIAPNTVHKTVSNLRKKLKAFGLSDELKVDGSNRDYYMLCHR